MRITSGPVIPESDIHQAHLYAHLSAPASHQGQPFTPASPWASSTESTNSTLNAVGISTGWDGPAPPSGRVPRRARSPGTRSRTGPTHPAHLRARGRVRWQIHRPQLTDPRPQDPNRVFPPDPLGHDRGRHHGGDPQQLPDLRLDRINQRPTPDPLIARGSVIAQRFARGVLRDHIDLAITLIGIPSARCNRRISAQSSTDNTPHLLPLARGQALGEGQFSVAVWGSVFTCRRQCSRVTTHPRVPQRHRVIWAKGPDRSECFPPKSESRGSRRETRDLRKKQSSI